MIHKSTGTIVSTAVNPALSTNAQYIQATKLPSLSMQSGGLGLAYISWTSRVEYYIVSCNLPFPLSPPPPGMCSMGAVGCMFSMGAGSSPDCVCSVSGGASANGTVTTFVSSMIGWVVGHTGSVAGRGASTNGAVTTTVSSMTGHRREVPGGCMLWGRVHGS